MPLQSHVNSRYIHSKEMKRKHHDNYTIIHINNTIVRSIVNLKKGMINKPSAMIHINNIIMTISIELLRKCRNNEV